MAPEFDHAELVDLTGRVLSALCEQRWGDWRPRIDTEVMRVNLVSHRWKYMRDPETGVWTRCAGGPHPRYPDLTTYWEIEYNPPRSHPHFDLNQGF